MKQTVIISVTWTLYWIFLPVILIASFLFRYNLPSCIYLIFALALPFSPRLSPNKITSWMAFSLSLTIISGLFLLAHIGFQIALLAHLPYGSLIGDGCSQGERIARYVGFQRFDHADAGDIFRLLLPDLIVFLVALLTHILSKKTAGVMLTLISNGDTRFYKKISISSVKLINGSMLCLSMLLMALAGIAYPNVLSFLYLFVFLMLSIMWALHRPLLVNTFAALRALLSVLTSLQLVFLFLYQMQFMQNLIPPDALSARLLGLTAIILTDCNATYKLLLHHQVAWTEFVNPVCIFLLHWSLAIGVRLFYEDCQVLQGLEPSASSPPRGLYRRPPSTERRPLVQEEEIPCGYDAIATKPSEREDSPEQEQSHLAETSKNGVLSKISAWFDEVKKYSFYIIALIVMMLWSVTYHSWLTFVLLLLSCVLWMTKKRAKFTLYCSPAFVVYGVCLVLLQYIYSLNLKESELPTIINQTSGNVLYLSEFGLHRFTYPCLHLGAQILYLLGFLIVLHQFKYHRSNISERSDEQDALTMSFTERVAHFVYGLLCKYWVFVVVGFHLAVATEGYPTAMKIVYMALFLLNLVTYSVSFSLWRKSLTLYWKVLVVYSMIVLVLIYTYQFKSFPRYWNSLTHFSDQQLADLGLIQTDSAGELLLQILVPTLFLLAVLFQMEYFNSRFLEYTGLPTRVVVQAILSSSESGELTTDEDGNQKSWFSRQFKKWWPIIVKAWDEITAFILNALEFHLWQLIFITVFVAAVYQVGALYAAFVVFWVLLLPFRKTHLLLFSFSSFVASLIMLGAMFYQLNFFTEDLNLSYNCSLSSFYGKNITKVFHLTNWIGVEKMHKSGIFFFYAEGYIAIVLMIALERTVIRRQEWLRTWHNKPTPKLTAFYPIITHKEMDDGLLSCVKFYTNYFFYKFGVEACFVMTSITVCVHSDIFSIIYCILLIIALTLKTRASLYRYWRFYVGILSLLIISQYLTALGLPPSWCKSHQYPWTTIGSNETIRNRLVLWLHLPDYIVVINTLPAIADFFQLLFVVCQLFVFEKESSWANLIGSNRYLTGEELDKVAVYNNPKKNFMLKGSKTLLDKTKHFIFKYSIWITMAIIFFAGTSRISIFTLGYLICFFYLLSKQEELLMGKPSRLLKIFNGFLGYTVAVITLKAGLQIASCVYIETLVDKACVFVQFMSLVCSKPVEYKVTEQSSDSCEVSYGNPGLYWDFICFLFLLIQSRIFASHYFLHVAEDMRTSMQLAARGAELFHEKLIEEAKKRELIQEQNITAIKTSMEVIKDAYKTLRRSLALQKTHTDATRSGDYYMFDDAAARSDLSIISEKEVNIIDPVDILHTAATESITAALHKREEDKNKLSNESEEVSDDKGAEDDKNDKDGHPTELNQISEECVVCEDSSVGIKLRKKSSSNSKEELHDAQDESEHEMQDAKSSLSQDESSEEEDENENIDNVSFRVKIKTFFLFIWELFTSGVDAFTLLLNQRNKDFRNIILQLSAEKDLLCDQKFKREAISPRSASSDITIDIDDGDAARAVATRKSLCLQEYVEVKSRDFDKDKNRLVRLCNALWYNITASTDMVCYFLIILNLMLKASLLALVLPLAVLLWATLSIPRPTKRFWMFTIVYLEVVVCIKFIFQFEFFPWNSQTSTNQHINHPFWWPRFLGIEQSPSWSVMDLLQLLAVFFHISVLKVHGLWDISDEDQYESEEEEDDEILALEDRPSTSHHDLVQTPVDSTEVEEDKESFVEAVKRVMKIPFHHMQTLLSQRFSSVTDVYLAMFMCDVINFPIIIFGYYAFGPHISVQSDVVSSLQTNNVPTGFLIMLLVQFIMMFIDRAIYLKKSLWGKIVFQIILVIGVHIWLFFILPSINQRSFYQNGVAQTWYFFKVLYFLLSAYQIRAGYPKTVTGNFLTKSYGTINLFLFKGYRAIPFLAEITAIMDWMYTGTSLGIGEWMKVWSIHAEVFEIKGWRTFEANYPSPRGSAKVPWIKYLMGGFLLALLLAIIWFPLLLMNVALTIGGITNNPEQVDIRVSMGSFEPIFQVVADSDDINKWTQDQYSAFSKDHSKDEVAASFLQRFSNEQIVSVNIDGESKTTWIISPPQKQLLAERMNVTSNSTYFRLLFEWTLTNDPSTAPVTTAYGSYQVLLTPDNPVRAMFYELLIGNPTVTNVSVPSLFPQFIYSPGSSSAAEPAVSLYPHGPSDYLGVDFMIQQLPNDTLTSWWSLSSGDAPVNVGADKKTPKINMVIFSDKVSPSSLSFLVNYGIIGLYVSVVLVVGRLVRSVFIGTTASIMFDELPYVDRILHLCHDLFLVREEGEFEMEEDLYAKLIFLYRSPKLLIEWTRKPKNE